MNVTVSNVLTIENPTQDALMWCKRNLTITNPEYAKKARMHFWFGNTPATLTLYETRGNALILPFGTLRNLPDCITKESTPNRHLQDLAPRYELQRIPDTLALQIVDLDMMGEVRSVHSPLLTERRWEHG